MDNRTPTLYNNNANEVCDIEKSILLSMAYNIDKYYAKKQQKRTGRQLFEELTA